MTMVGPAPRGFVRRQIRDFPGIDGVGFGVDSRWRRLRSGVNGSGSQRLKRRGPTSD